MKAWLIYNKEDAYKNERYIQFYMEEGKRFGIYFKLILVEKLAFGVRQNEPFLDYNEDITYFNKPDFIICRTIYPFLTAHLERMGYPVLNNTKVASICNDKARTYEYLSNLGIEIIESEFCKNQYFYDKVNNEISNKVIKAVSGHGGNQVFFLDKPTKQQIDVVYHGLQLDDFVIQPLIGRKHQDLRVYVIGKSIIAAVLRTAKEGFKSNFSLGGEVTPYQLNKKEQAIVNKIIEQFDFDFVGIDFIIGDNNNLIFNEIEDVVGSRMLYQCTDINIVRLYLEYIINKIEK